MSKKLKCKNTGKWGKPAYYTGKEPSPKGNGYCARYEKKGSRRKGKDGKYWVVRVKANGSKYWAKESSQSKEKMLTIKYFTPNQWKKATKNISTRQRNVYKTLLDLAPVFNKNGINVFYTIWVVRYDSNGNVYWFADDPWDDLLEKDPDHLDKPYLIIPFKAHTKTKLMDQKHIYISHTGIEKKLVGVVHNIMKPLFGKYYDWNGYQNRNILIKW